MAPPEFDHELQCRLLEFQRKHGIPGTGMVCTETWRKLMEGAATAKPSQEQETHDREAAAHREADDRLLAELGTSRQEVVDQATMTRGELTEKYGLWRQRTFRTDISPRIPGAVAYRVVPLQDVTRYQQQSGRVATNADESANLAREYTPPETATGGVVRGGLLLGGVSRENAENAGKLGDAVSTIGTGALARWARASGRGGTQTPSTPERATQSTGAGPKSATTPAARVIPPGMSLNEVREEDSRAKYFPNAFEPVAKQPGVDWVNGKPTETWRQDGAHVTQTLSGGTWIQGKRLMEDAKTPVDQRIRAEVSKARAKFEGPVARGESTRSATMTDGPARTKFTTTLTNPEDLLIHIEVPNLGRMSQQEQRRLRQVAEDALTGWRAADGTYEGLPLRVEVVDAPPEPQ